MTVIQISAVRLKDFDEDERITVVTAKATNFVVEFMGHNLGFRVYNSTEFVGGVKFYNTLAQVRKDLLTR